MKSKLLKVSLIALLMVPFLIGIFAKIPVFTPRQQRKPPPKIIRTCCQFGSDVTMFGMPFRKLNAISAPALLGQHVYLGDKEENNGIIYTHRGGFIDVGHLRDQADWTAFLYFNILQNRSKQEMNIRLGREGGVKSLVVKNAPELTDRDRLAIAGHIAFDLSVWHELSTWFGVSYIPLIPERYSSFSPEDLYSNALGVLLGMDAIQSARPFEAAMTRAIQITLDTLMTVETIEDTKKCMQAVEGKWWTRRVPLPSGRFLINRYYDAYRPLQPWLIPQDEGHYVPKEIRLVDKTIEGRPLTDYYTLKIRTNFRVPVKKIFPERKTHEITNMDFPAMIRWVREDVARKEARHAGKG